MDREEDAVHDWSAQPRRSRLAGLLRPWTTSRRPLAPPAPAADAAPAPTQGDPLSAIPILTLPSNDSATPAPVTFVNPLTSQPLQLHGLPAGLGSDTGAEAQRGAWLGQLADPLPRTASAGSLLSGMSACSCTSSRRSSEDAGPGHVPFREGGVVHSHHAHASAGSFVCPPCPTAVALPSSSGSSSSSSQSSMLNLWMQQAEPELPPCPPLPQGAAPTAEAAAEGTTALRLPLKPAAEPGTTSNPLLQQLPEPQAALLSWRRHAHSQLGGERREPDLLRRLLSAHSDDLAAATDALLSPSAGPPAGAPRGRASGRHLVLLTASLALVVLLLHGLHSHALEQQLAGEQQDQQQMLLYQAAALEAAQDVGTAAAGLEDGLAAGLGVQQPAVPTPQLAARAHGSSQPGRRFGQQHYSLREAAYLGRLPRLHLRRRLTLLLFRQHGVHAGITDTADGRSKGAGSFEEFVFEEWELSMGRR